MGFSPSGAGEHDFLWIEKEGANTAWVAKKLAGHAGVRDVDVGYSGRKDRNARTRQWFSVKRPTAAGTDWGAFEEFGVRIHDVDRHDKKLRRGTHRQNRFRIAIRGINAAQEEIDPWLNLIHTHGVPNYFGEQRFGRNGSNILRAGELFAGKRMRRNQRNIYISAARSYLFNEILQARVISATWNKAMAGDTFNLDGTNSIFVDDPDSANIDTRLASLDIHPTAALWGRGEPLCREDVATLEKEVVAACDDLRIGLERHGVDQSRRATRLVVKDLASELADDTLWLDFSLNKGAYATSVLREIIV